MLFFKLQLHTFALKYYRVQGIGMNIDAQINGSTFHLNSGGNCRVSLAHSEITYNLPVNSVKAPLFDP